MADDPPDIHPLAQAAIDAHAQIAPQVTAEKRAHLVEMLETFEQDIAPLVGPFIQHVIDDESTPEHVRSLLSPLVAPQHFGESVVIGIAVGSILSPVLQAALDPLLAELAKGAWKGAIGSAGALGGLPQSPAVLTAAVLKGVLTEDNAASQAILSGTTPDTFSVMVQAAGNAIGLAEALLLFRRGQIDAARLLEVERYSNLNPRFYDMVPMLRYAPISVGEAITAALKGHMSDADAQQAIGFAGIDPSHFAVLKASAGRPLGLEQMLHLWNRQIVDRAFVEQGIRQSDINDDYLDAALELKHYYPPPRSLVPMLKAKAITDAQFETWMSYYGATPDVVEAFRKEANHAGNSGVKELSQAQTARVYSNRLIDRPTAETRLTALGYPSTDADLILDLADNARTERLLTATINKIGSLYVAHKMTKPAAAVSLNAAHVPTAAQQDLFELWDVERSANLHYPTVAGVVGALRRGLIDPKETYQRLTQLGVQESDLAIVVGDGWPPTKPDDAQAAATAVIHQTSAIPGAGGGPGSAHKTLTASQVTRLYSAGTISPADAVARLVTLGYTEPAARELLTLVSPPVGAAP